jgi:hypothetical protein
MGGNHDTKGSIQDLRGQSLGSVALLSAMATENPDLLLKNLSHDGRPLGFINCIEIVFFQMVTMSNPNHLSILVFEAYSEIY